MPESERNWNQGKVPYKCYLFPASVNKFDKLANNGLYTFKNFTQETKFY